MYVGARRAFFSGPVGCEVEQVDVVYESGVFGIESALPQLHDGTLFECTAEGGH